MPALFDHQLERAVLAILVDESSLDIPRTRLLLDQTRLTPADMHLPLHSKALDAAVGLLRDGLPVDALAVASRLPEVSREKLVALLITDSPITAHALPGYAQTLKSLAVRRRAVTAAEDARAAAVDLEKPIEEVIAGGSSAWAALTQQSVSVRTGAEHTLVLMDDLQAAQEGKHTLCVPTGIDLWDQAMGGLGCGELTFLGSQPGVGKSSVIATIIDNLARREVRTGLFSLEDLGKWLPRRLIALDAAVPLFVLAKKPLTRAQMERVGAAAEGVYARMQNVLIDDRSMLTADAIVETARDMILNRGVKVLILDHLGKVDHQFQKHARPDLAYEHTLNKLTAVAKDHNVPILIAAHLKGRDEDEKYKRPHATSFAQAAFIERDARAAAALYLDRDDPDSVLVAVVKQTNGNGDDTFALRRIKEAGLVQSVNGRLQGLPYAADEARLLEMRGVA